jgi:RNA polymerase sigma-70 factor (ECF subfamily)
VDPADKSDIQASLGGDGSAYARLVSRHQQDISRLLWRFTRDPHTHEELVQDAFVEAYMSLSSYRGKAPFASWLRTLATRVGYRFWKQQARERKHGTVPLQDWDQESSGPTDEATAAADAAGTVHNLLQELGLRDRLVLTLMYLEDHSVDEIASLTGWSRTMVKVQAYRARKRLKRLFEEARPQ